MKKKKLLCIFYLFFYIFLATAQEIGTVNEERLLTNELKGGTQLLSWFEKGKWFYALFPSTNKEITLEEIEKYKHSTVESLLKEFEKIPNNTELQWNVLKVSFLKQVNPPAKEIKQIFGAAHKKQIKVLR